MSKKSPLRENFQKQHGKRAQALLKPDPHQLYHIHWSLLSQLSWKESLLLTCQILGLFVNTLAADEKYPVLNRDNLTIPIQMQFSQKQKTFSELFAAFLEAIWNFERFEKQMASVAFVFPNLRTLKMWLDKWLKNPVPDDPSTSNMVNVPKHCWNLHHSTFIIFIDHWQGNCVLKSLSYWHAKSWDCLLTHWMPMTSILLLTMTI